MIRQRMMDGMGYPIFRETHMSQWGLSVEYLQTRMIIYGK